jgi:2'-5' RNA ligase
MPVPVERLFVALALPDPVRTALVGLTQSLRGVVWTPPAQLHLTLRFLGNVPTDQIEPLAARLATVRVEPFILPVEGLGGFPPKRPPHILWVGVGSGHPRLHQLRQQLDDTLLAAGIEVDLRTFHPHVTLARCADGAAAVGHWLHAHREFVAPPFRVESFELFASELRPDGAVHTLKRSFPLVK